jgi:tRNA 2-selenouridine synthase
MDKQPTTEQFENILAASWLKLDFSKRIWLEDEAKSIGKVFIPDTLWNKMKKAPIVKINVPKTARIRRLISDYGNADKKLLAEAIVRITKRLGPQHAKLALEELEKGNLSAVADITLTYYDKAYAHDHEKREMKNIFPIKTSTDDAMENAEKVIEFCEKMLEKIYA